MDGEDLCNICSYRAKPGEKGSKAIRRVTWDKWYIQDDLSSTPVAGITSGASNWHHWLLPSSLLICLKLRNLFISASSCVCPTCFQNQHPRTISWADGNSGEAWQADRQTWCTWRKSWRIRGRERCLIMIKQLDYYIKFNQLNFLELLDITYLD